MNKVIVFQQRGGLYVVEEGVKFYVPAGTYFTVAYWKKGFGDPEEMGKYATADEAANVLANIATYLVDNSLDYPFFMP